ncbi:hypothetical protein SLS58_006076 [Diplodia intermedia]|uniref:Uncharacterized protein n=1 Tax=Diplodia intermedia TaxID=856260 RepID=A0ABR3TPS2_9PEZI
MMNSTMNTTQTSSSPSTTGDPIFELLERILPTRFFNEPAVEGQISFAIRVIPPHLPERPANIYHITWKKTPCAPRDLIAAWAEMKLERKHNALKPTANDDGVWIPLREWLLKYFSSHNPVETSGFGSRQWEMNYDWACNGKTFRLLDLPPELRDLIYDHAAPFCYPYYYRKRSNFLGLSAAATSGHTLLPADYGVTGSHVQTEYKTRGCKIVNAAASVLSMLLLNKQVHAEFKKRMWDNMEFSFVEPKLLAWFLAQNTTLSSLYDGRMPERLSVEFSLANLFFTAKRWHVASRWHVAAMENDKTDVVGLVAKLHLKSLTIYVDHRNRTHYPDRRRPDDDDDDDDDDDEQNQSTREYCSRLLTGRFLLRLRAAVTHIPDVTILGCVSPRMRGLFATMHARDLQGVPCDTTQEDFVGRSKLIREAGLEYTSPLSELQSLARRRVDDGSVIHAAIPALKFVTDTHYRDTCFLFDQRHSTCNDKIQCLPNRCIAVTFDDRDSRTGP